MASPASWSRRPAARCSWTKWPIFRWRCRSSYCACWKTAWWSGWAAGRRGGVDFRLVTATNRDIQALIDGGRFRLDLYYRLSGVVLRVPALGQRLEDIPALLHHFVQAFCQRNGVPVPQVMPDVARHLASRRWPGNVRQLRQKIEEALVFCDGSRLRVQDFARGEENRVATMVATMTPPATYPLGQVFAPEDTPPRRRPPARPGLRRRAAGHRPAWRQQEAGRAGAGHFPLPSV